jgi:predicted HicB family RNase H-like nuclease
MLKYKGYVGVFEFDEKTHLFLGKVANSYQLITFKGRSVESTEQDFKNVINEHINWYKQHGKKPEKPLCIFTESEKV